MKTNDMLILAGAALAAWWILAPQGRVSVGRVSAEPQTPRQVEAAVIGDWQGEFLAGPAPSFANSDIFGWL